MRNAFILGILAAVPMTAGVHAQETYRVSAAETAVDLVRTPLSVKIPGSRKWVGAVVRAMPDGKPAPGQIEAVGDGVVVHWVADIIKAGSSPAWEVRLAEVKPASAPRIRVTADRAPGVDISVDGALVTRYVTSGNDVKKPFFYPVQGPGGKMVTRHFPMKKGVTGERGDHPHHRSFWFTHGSVNGVDFWAESAKTGRIRHRGFKTLSGGDVFAHLSSTNDWGTVGGEKILEERRDVKIYPLGGGESIWDFDLELAATDAPVKFGSTKEGSFGIRVAGTMKQTSGGKIINSRGAKGAGQAWGKPAEWIDYYGAVGGETVGVTIMDHPTSFRHPIHWHVRDYGLFAANPFGHRHFYGRKAEKRGEHEMNKGESIRFRFRVYFHAGNTAVSKVPQVYAGFSFPPVLTVVKAR